MKFEVWKENYTRPERLMIYPDGCRDIIIARTTARTTRILTDLDDRARAISLPAKSSFFGVRLRPGATFREKELEEIRPGDEPELLLRAIEDLVEWNDEIFECLQLITQDGKSLQATARMAGISLRTMQRLFREKTGYTAAWWRSLARARLAAQLVVEGRLRDTSLADAAFEAGYADQAHMTREFRRWFSSSPAQLSASDLSAITSPKMALYACSRQVL